MQLNFTTAYMVQIFKVFISPFDNMSGRLIETKCRKLPFASIWSRRTLERHNVRPRLALAMARPCVHQLAPPRQRVRSPIGLLGLVADDVSESMFGKLAREVRFVARPIAE